MDSFLDSVLTRLSTPSARLVLVALASSSLTALSIYSLQSLRREHALSSLKAEATSIKPTQVHRLNSIGAEDIAAESKETQIARQARRGEYDEELVMEQLARNRVFFGEQGMERIRKGFVIVVGAGGVGSWAATMLARSGIGRIRVIDFDQVTLSSLNRHASATLSSVGTPKATSLCTFLSTISPFINFEPIIDLWTLETAPQLLSGSPDYIIDCIDNISTKIDLLAYCHENGLKVISSMGSGCKADPTRVQVGDISETAEDPLSRSTRRGLRQRGIEKGVQVVFSTEKPTKEGAKLLPLPEEEFQKGSVDELSALPNFRVRILPVVGTMPAIFGLTCANLVLMKLANYPISDQSFFAASKLRPRLYSEIHTSLKSKFDSYGTSTQQPNCPFNVDDVGYIIEEVFGGRSILEPFHTSRLTITKWRKEGEVAWGNVVVMTKAEGKEHEKRVLKGGEDVEGVYGEEVVKRVEEIWREERGMRGVRWGEMYAGKEL